MNTSIPRIALSAYELLKRNGIKTKAKNIVIIGRVKKVGVPINLLLGAQRKNGAEDMDATVTTCNKFTPIEDLKNYCLMADIIISAAHQPKLISADMVKPGATVIDAGFSIVDGKTVGDVDFDEVLKVAGKITPNPGGVGPMLVATLMLNTFIACKKVAELRRG
jgi:5,10-methylene-tetrahydrofolate dehydrogenase/methenyl tetrahydrofolate cyclohydrolase